MSMKNSILPFISLMAMGGGSDYMDRYPSGRIPRGNVAGDGNRSSPTPVKKLQEFTIRGKVIMAENRKSAIKIYEHSNKASKK